MDGIKLKYFTLLLLVLFVVISGFVLFSQLGQKDTPNSIPSRWWEIQSIDTVKFSRDLAKERMSDIFFVNVVDKQISSIAETGVTHVAIGTPYDEEFLPFLRMWVNSIRRQKLNVWFRGNFSGWEGWFDYPFINEEEHLEKTRKFILENSELFEDGDIFSSCTECENGRIGDPRDTKDVDEYRKFLINEYAVSRGAFEEIDKDVASNYFSMNADVALLVMDKVTTRELGNIVVIDHYVRDPEELSKDIEKISETSGGSVVLGEFGAPIPDIHGRMDNEAQSAWLREVMGYLSKNNNAHRYGYCT